MGYAVIAASVLLAAGFVLYDRHRTPRILENLTRMLDMDMTGYVTAD